MAISHAQPLLLILFVSLLVLPALGISKFQNCNTGQHYPVEVKTVTMSPDPVKRIGNGNVTITGYTSKDIPEGASVKLGLSISMIPVSKKSYSLCDITTCPVAPGPFVLTLSNVFTRSELRSRAYYVSVSITEEDTKESMMCVVFACAIRGHASMISQVTE